MNTTVLHRILEYTAHSSINDAANAGNLRGIKYLRKQGQTWDESMCVFAAYNGHLDCLKYAHEHGLLDGWTEVVCLCAATGGHLDCLKYVHEHGCPWDKWTCSYAARDGHLDCLRYAHENGCPWDEETCQFAASRGHLECLKYLRENGCPWNQDTYKNADLACKKYMESQGFQSYRV